MKIKVVGIATGSRNVEVWHFDAHNDLCKRFCEILSRDTGYNVVVIEGEVIGTYKPSQPPIEYIPFEDRFKEFAERKGLPSSYSGERVNEKEEIK